MIIFKMEKEHINFESRKEARKFADNIIKKGNWAVVTVGEETFHIDSPRSREYFGIKRK